MQSSSVCLFSATFSLEVILVGFAFSYFFQYDPWLKDMPVLAGKVVAPLSAESEDAV